MWNKRKGMEDIEMNRTDVTDSQGEITREENEDRRWQVWQK